MGFIGGGAILRLKDSVKGTATAASLWITGAIGASVALGAAKVEAGVRSGAIIFVLHAAEAADDDPRISATDLAAFLAGQFTDAGWSRTDHYAWISSLLLELGITSLSELREVLRDVDVDSIESRMGYRYPPGAVRRLDDALLSVYGQRYVELHGNAHRVPLLAARLDKFTG